jgi:hypothetical protein
MRRFYLGTHQPYWLWGERTSLFPMFVSFLRLKRYAVLKRATGPWALDSGGFSVIAAQGSWDSVPMMTYVAAVRRYRDEIGNLLWAAPQDWMCEPFMLHKTGMTVAEHQRKTVASYTDLINHAPDCPWIPVVQGFSADDYSRCVDMYYKARVYLHELPLVGVGSVCRRQGTDEVTGIIQSLWADGLKIHAFGFKLQGIRATRQWLESADSMAWSFQARRRPPLPGHLHASCANCYEYAERWLASVPPADPVAAAFEEL